MGLKWKKQGQNKFGLFCPVPAIFFNHSVVKAFWACAATLKALTTV